MSALVLYTAQVAECTVLRYCLIQLITAKILSGIELFPYDKAGNMNTEEMGQSTPLKSSMQMQGRQ